MQRNIDKLYNRLTGSVQAGYIFKKSHRLSVVTCWTPGAGACTTVDYILHSQAPAFSVFNGKERQRGLIDHHSFSWLIGVVPMPRVPPLACFKSYCCQWGKPGPAEAHHFPLSCPSSIPVPRIQFPWPKTSSHSTGSNLPKFDTEMPSWDSRLKVSIMGNTLY